MPNIESLIQNSQKLTEFFGCWPSFHDADVIDLHFWRGDVKPGDWDPRNIFPVLTVKVRVLAATPILATLRFHDVDDFKMQGFNHMNGINDLSVSIQERGTFTTGERLPPWLVVEFQRGDGMSASFRCFRIECEFRRKVARQSGNKLPLNPEQSCQ